MSNDSEQMTLEEWSERFKSKTLFHYRYFQLPDSTIITYDPFQHYTIIYKIKQLSQNKDQKFDIDWDDYLAEVQEDKDENYNNLQQLTAALNINVTNMGIAYKQNPRIGTK